MKQLTVKEALEQGYTSCTPMYEEFEFIPLQECPFINPNGYEIIAQDTKPYQIAYGTIEDLLDGFLENQEDVENESGKLEELMRTVDFTEITNKINAAFYGTKYYHGTEIKLIP